MTGSSALLNVFLAPLSILCEGSCLIVTYVFFFFSKLDIDGLTKTNFNISVCCKYGT